MDEVDVEPVDLGRELRQSVQLLFDPAPVVLVRLLQDDCCELLYATLNARSSRPYSREAISSFGGGASLRPAQGRSRSRRPVATWCPSRRARRRPASCLPFGAVVAAAFRSGSRLPTGEARSARCSGRHLSSSGGTRTVPGA